MDADRLAALELHTLEFCRQRSDIIQMFKNQLKNRQYLVQLCDVWHHHDAAILWNAERSQSEEQVKH